VANPGIYGVVFLELFGSPDNEFAWIVDKTADKVGYASGGI